MHSWFYWGAVALGFLSGALWVYAARINVPTHLVTAYGGPIVGLDEMRAGFEKQATWNSWAATCTALAVFCQVVATLVP
jgi:hypothetical protein